MKILDAKQIMTADINQLPQTRTPPPTEPRRDDLKALFKVFDVSTFMYRSDIRKTLPLVRNDEILFYLKPTKATIANKDGSNRNIHHGAIFFSNRRVLFRATSGMVIEEFDLHDIHSVASQKTGFVSGQLSFCTDKQRVDFDMTSSESTVYGRVESTLIRVVMEFGPNLYVEKLRQDHGSNSPAVQQLQDSVANKARVVECTSCAAQNIIIPGIVGKCEYCDRLID